MQARYANDPQKMNEMIAQLYQEENVNPLAGIHYKLNLSSINTNPSSYKTL
jgi:membrane protein insertase Oxa1/YidC/SpoIIIJ